MEFVTWIAFLITWTLLSFTPGPGVLNTLSHSFSLGLSRALPNILGQQVALLLMFSIVGAGLGIFLSKNPDHLLILQWCGALYLMYLGAQLWREAETTAPAVSVELSSVSSMELFSRGLIANIANPKGILFYVAFLPQFVLPSRPQIPQYLVITVTAVTVNFLVMLIYGSAAARISSLLERPEVNKLIGRVFGGLFVVIAVALLLE